MANRLLSHPWTLEKGVVKLYGNFTTSTSGTIASSSCKGFTVAKTAAETGRYTVTLADSWKAFMGVCVTIVGAADAAYTSAKGLTHIVRNVSMTNKTFDVQFNDPDGSPADAELEDGASVYLEITLKNTGAY